jgi:HAD superfamily phosphoserine phosphatase-like hydrolase
MEWSSEVKAALYKVLQSQAARKTAVFDADGTLWHEDAGESFFKYQIQNSLAPGIQGLKDPWHYYKRLEEQNRSQAYSWLAQINAGMPEQQLRNQVREFYRHQFKDKIPAPVLELIGDLKARQFEIWICSASIRWTLEPALDFLGLDRAKLIATEVEVDENGKLTKKVVTPVPYIEGKKYWVEKKLGEQPLMVAGNSMGDIDMLALAQELPLVICFMPHLPEIESSEIALEAEAKKRGWPRQVFNSK